MKVILTGAQGTGKTTLIDRVAPDYDVSIIKEVVRSFIAQHPETKYNEDGDERSQKLFFNVFELALSTGNYIADRGLVDVCAYTRWLCEIGKIDFSVYHDMILKLQQFTKSHPDIFYIYIPIKFSVSADGFRSTNELYRGAIDMYIKEILSMLDQTIPHERPIYYTLQSIHIEDRVEELKDILSSHT